MTFLRIDWSFQLREEKIDLENALEAESESHVNRLSREISALRLAQQQTVNGSGSLSPVETRLPLNGNPLEPSTEMMLDAMRRENEALRGRLIETERDYIRISRLNEIYREELIEHRRRVSYMLSLLYQRGSLLSVHADTLQAWTTRGQSHRSCPVCYGSV